MHAGQWDVAETLFSDALELAGTDDRAHWGLAESLWQRGEKQTALKHMEEAVRLSASDPRLMQRLGKMYLDLNRVADADRQSLAALQADRQSADVWGLRGDCLVKQGDHEGALAAYHQALAIQPDFPDVQLAVAELYRKQERYDRLLATIDRLQETVGDGEVCPARAHVLRGIALHHLQRPVDAQRCFQVAIARDPDNPEPHLHLAALLIEQGDAQAAREPLQRAIALSPQSPDAIALAHQVRGAADATSEGFIGQAGASTQPRWDTSQPKVGQRTPPANRR